eukprot:CAMPEP_0177619192 /NCGR_PEP_ID=MMETSP0419_2-20121207/26107_1 /TAXON_ID=582737 /ORGANISM="Tetraselmis sp., Strain GSL018" /LENGTH=315 /DNA_ID=CAMNT_0019118399 /DNA_START=254 /DNA_END=1204 /DNA_ORIENTATION=-
MAETTHVTIPPPFHPTFDIEGSIRAALEEDSGSFGDVTALSTIPEDTQAVATFLAKGDGVLAGLAVADKVFEMVDPRISVEWSAKDGDSVTYGTIFGKVRGPARGVLVAERVALNYMQRMGGIATATAEMVKEAEGFPAKILETRKTVPGLRLFDKWAVLIGGGDNHRMGLYDMIMIKDNHIAAAGGLTQAVERAQAFLTEKNSLKDNHIAAAGGLTQAVERAQDGLYDMIMIKDNHIAAAGGLTQAVERAQDGLYDMIMIKDNYIGGRVETEGSGNVNLRTVRRIASTGVTYISVGALTHSVKALDISFNIETQ